MHAINKSKVASTPIQGNDAMHKGTLHPAWGPKDQRRTQRKGVDKEFKVALYLYR